MMLWQDFQGFFEILEVGGILFANKWDLVEDSQGFFGILGDPLGKSGDSLRFSGIAEHVGILFANRRELAEDSAGFFRILADCGVAALRRRVRNLPPCRRPCCCCCYSFLCLFPCKQTHNTRQFTQSRVIDI